MKLNYFTKKLSTVGRWVATTVLMVSAMAFIWQGALFSNSTAMAAPNTNLIASSNVGDRISDATNETSRKSKNFIRDTADKVEEAARSNARKVENASDNNGSLVERKARKDAARIEAKAEKDAARTQRAVDNNLNAVERTIDNIKDAFTK